MDELDVEAGTWYRQGCSVIWEPKALLSVVNSNAEVTPIATAMRYYKTSSWPEELPAKDGRAMVVVGLDGCLEGLPPQQREEWLKGHVTKLVRSFYAKYDTQCSLIFYFERGINAFKQDLRDAFLWRPSQSGEKPIPIMRFLYGGRFPEIKRLVPQTGGSREPWGIYVANPS
jgi:hypothetical protein